jgi:hypothetical protein
LRLQTVALRMPNVCIIRNVDGGDQRAASKAYEELGEARVGGSRGGGVGATAGKRAADWVADVAGGVVEAAGAGAGD